MPLDPGVGVGVGVDVGTGVGVGPSAGRRSHNHPSRLLSYAQIADLGRACSWFLGSGASRS
jgi:hypothetical protein